ncbi:MAG: Flp family type IVb pilin [Aestuariivirgaceae bacterium]
MSNFVKFLRAENGATAIEYALIAGATGLLLIAVLPGLESSLNGTFTSLSSAM